MLPQFERPPHAFSEEGEPLDRLVAEDEADVAVRDLASDRSTSAQVRAVIDGPTGYDAELWRMVTDLGLPAMAVADAVWRSEPVHVLGDIEWAVNRTEHGYWISLMNSRGNDKPQQGLSIAPKGAVQATAGIVSQPLASSVRVLRITHDKPWINDDDPGITAPGWTRAASGSWPTSVGFC